MNKEDSTELDYPLDLESKLPLANNFRCSRFMKGAFMKNNQLDDNSIESKNVAELSSFNLLLQKDNSPNTLSSKSPKSLFDKKKEISFEKSAFLEANEDKIMQESAIYSIKKQKKPNENEKNKEKPNFLTTVKNVSMAIKNLKNNTIFKAPKYLTEEQINHIKDPVFFHEQSEKSNDEINLLLSKNKYMKIYYRLKIKLKNSFVYESAVSLKKLISKLFFVIEPDNKWKIFWDFFIIFVYLMLFFIMAIQLSFGLLVLQVLFPHNNSMQRFTQLIILLFLLVDIILKCITAYYENGILVKISHKILKNYLTSHFVYDLLAIVPMILETIRIFESESEEYSKNINLIMKLSQFLIYFKFFEVSKALETLDDILQLEERSQAFFNLIKLVIEILLFSHLIACAWNGVASYSPYHETMLEVEDLLHKKWFNRYLTFLFWTICPEKLEPKNELEYGFGFFAVLASHAVFGFIIEGIHSILENLGEKNAQMKKDIRIINKFLDKKNISYELQMKIRKYFYFLNEHHVENSLKELEVINKLPNSLKEELLIKSNWETINAIPLFSKNFSIKTIKEIVLNMKKVRFYPEEVIFQQGDSKDDSLYLINEGEIQLLMDTDENLKKKIDLKLLKKGEFFGESSFFSGGKRQFKAVSSSFSTLYMIKRSDFLRIIANNTKDYENFCMIRDQMFVYNNLEPLNKKCVTCSKKDHNIFFCPEIHYVARREFIIKKYLFSQPLLERKKITRFLRKKVNAKLISKKLEQYDANINENPLNEEVDEGTIENFSESELNNIPESPAIKSADLRHRVNFDNNNLEVLAKEKNEKSKNFEENHEIELENNVNLHHFNQENSNNSIGLNGKKKTYENLEIKPTNNRRGSKFSMGKQPSLSNDNDNFQTALLSGANSSQKHWEINFEKMQNFTKYFPSNNCDVLIKKYQIIIEKNRARIQKLKNIKKRRTILGESNSPTKSRSKFGNESLAFRKNKDSE